MSDDDSSQLQLADLYSFDVDEFNCISTVVSSSQEAAKSCTDVAGFQPQSSGFVFTNVFADDDTRALFVRILDFVRSNRETVSFPFRCDGVSHSNHYITTVHPVQRKHVRFSNRLLDSDERPLRTRWLTQPENADNTADYIVCSLCNRLNEQSEWVEFQEMIDRCLWDSEKLMYCGYTVCTACERGVEQRLFTTDSKRTDPSSLSG